MLSILNQLERANAQREAGESYYDDRRGDRHHAPRVGHGVRPGAVRELLLAALTDKWQETEHVAAAANVSRKRALKSLQGAVARGLAIKRLTRDHVAMWRLP